jgi:hypothetical protein
MFGIVVMVTVQSVFRLEKHQNNFFKIIFDVSTSKRFINIKTNSFYTKNLNFKETQCTKHALNVKSNGIIRINIKIEASDLNL